METLIDSEIKELIWILIELRGLALGYLSSISILFE